MNPVTAMKRRFIRTLKYYYLKVRRLRGTPEVLAGGAAIGVFVGLTPTIPFHTPLTLLFSLLTKSSTVAAFLSSWLVFNPFTLVPIYYCSLRIGNYLTPYHVNFNSLEYILREFQSGSGITPMFTSILSLGYETSIVLVVGGFVFSLPFAILSYYGALSFFKHRNLRTGKKL